MLVRDAAGAFEPQAFICTDEATTPFDVLRFFVRRWSVEVTFAEVRRHLGIETQRQWSDLAIARTTPCLLALFSLVTLWAKLDRGHAKRSLVGWTAQGSDLSARGLIIPRRAAWYAKPGLTFSDAIAAVRRQLWIKAAFSTSRLDRDMVEIPKTLRDSLTNAACYPA